MTTTQELISVGIIAVFTFLTRVLPFFAFPNNKPVPRYIEYLGKALPSAVIGMLIVYCLKAVTITSFPFGLPESIAVIFVVSVHKWKHNMLLSILGGTVLYMALIQAVFV